MTTNSGVQAVVDDSGSSSAADYSTVEIPAKPPSEYTYYERRAEILQMIQEVGHPSRIHQTEVAERYGVTQQQISQDISRISESVHEHVVDRDRRVLVVDSVVQRSIRGLLDEEEYHKAAKTAMAWDGWIDEFHDLEEIEARLDQLEAANGVG